MVIGHDSGGKDLERSLLRFPRTEPFTLEELNLDQESFFESVELCFADDLEIVGYLLVILRNRKDAHCSDLLGHRTLLNQ